jgi:hypothetical protein
MGKENYHLVQWMKAQESTAPNPVNYLFYTAYRCPDMMEKNK